MQKAQINTQAASRSAALNSWLRSLDLGVYSLHPLPADASFRSYIRLATGDRTYMLMDSPPELEPCAPFVAIAKGMRQHGVPVPEVLAEDSDLGFLLLTDFGDEQYLQSLQSGDADKLYGQAMECLHHIQDCTDIADYKLPKFDASEFEYELQHFVHWYLVRYRKLELTSAEQSILQDVFNKLINMALAQPQVFTHRDYHSRNLMLRQDGSLGILDFQDALWGPVTYDLVSMLRDCYIDWPEEQVYAWAKQFYNKLLVKNITTADWQTFQCWFDWMGMQRHLKASFIFARKYLRDNDKRYLADIPRTLNYVAYVAGKYPEFKDFNIFLRDRVLL